MAKGDVRVKDGKILMKDNGWRSKIDTVIGGIEVPVTHPRWAVSDGDAFHVPSVRSLSGGVLA
eukprot:COSAG06_NODE_941_length_11384_cov_4.377492_6_plen_63_part_00